MKNGSRKTFDEYLEAYNRKRKYYNIVLSIVLFVLSLYMIFQIKGGILFAVLVGRLIIYIHSSK